MPATVHWGFFDKGLQPVLHVRSGDIVTVKTVTHHAGDAPDLMLDDGVRELFESVPMARRGPGKHILVGPIFVEEAWPGDTLVVEYMDMVLRSRYGSNVAAHWGCLHADLGPEERVTVFELDATRETASPLFSYRYPCEYARPGRVVPPEEAVRVPPSVPLRIPLRPHIGCAGVAPKGEGSVSSVPPGDHGGNVDNWRMGAGSRMYYPVFHRGALFSLGDPHAAQGDGEVSGTAVESPLDVTMRLTVRRGDDLPFPVLETPAEWMVHGFGATLDAAMRQAASRAVRFLCRRTGLHERESYSLVSAAVDFGVTQAVDQTLGVHARISKTMLRETGD